MMSGVICTFVRILVCYVKKCSCHATCSHNHCMAEIHLHHHNSKSSFWCYQGSIAEAAGYNEETVIVGRALQKDFEQRGVHLDSHRQHQALQMSEDIATLGMDISMQSCLLSHYAFFKDSIWLSIQSRSFNLSSCVIYLVWHFLTRLS